MKVLLVLAHQNTAKNSFCHAIADRAKEELETAGHAVLDHDLYDESFDPVLQQPEVLKDGPVDPVVQAYNDELQAADAIVIIHPNWWGQLPAILKGWIDRVLRQGVAYQFDEGGAIIGLLAGKKALVLTTSNTPREIELQAYGDPLENLWKNCIFNFCGVTDFHRRNFESIVMSTPEQRSQWLEEVSELVKEKLL